jgi:hypothetical protein
MVKVECFTNLDDFKRVEWPTEMTVRPQVGDFVEGRMGNRRPRLRIVSLTHMQRDEVGSILQVELHH